jgi:hypothetical protein
VDEGSEKFELACAVGGMQFRLCCRNPVLARAAHELVCGYEIEHAAWPLALEGRAPEAFPPASDLVCERVGKGWRVQLRSELAIAFEQDRARAWVAQLGDRFGVGAVQNVIRLCMVLRGTLLLHAAGIVHEGKAYLFAGKSGAGKSTLARLFAHEAMLGDEIMCIDDADFVHRAPFTGERLAPPVPLSAPLGAIISFAQGEYAIARADARAVLRHVFNPSRDRVLATALVDRVTRLKAPIFRATWPMPSSELLQRILATVAHG